MAYEELVKRLRELPHLLFVQLHGHEDVVYKAADAIEELQHSLDIMGDANAKLRNQVPDWTPVTERLPKKSGNYLTAFGDGTAMAVNEFMHPRDWLTEEGRKANPNGKWYWGGVTHWMPIPEPPKEEV